MLLSQAHNLDSTNLQTLFWLATTEFDLRAYNDAQIHIQKVLQVSGAKATLNDLTLAAQTHMALDFHQEALLELAQAKKLLKNEKDYQTLGLATLQQQCEFALAAYQGGAVQNQRALLGANLNTKYDEYGPIFHPTNGHLYFTSRNPDTKGANLNPDDQRYFEDMYHAQWDTVSLSWKMNKLTFSEWNTNGFDALTYVNENGLFGLCTINTSATEKTTKSSDIFEIIGEEPLKWSSMDVIKNKSINTDYFEGAASLAQVSDNEQKMIFVSDRKGDVSGTDLYSVSRIDELWQSAERLPNEINSLGDETTPYLTEDGQFLFFSSRGLPGYGGYDIFYSQLVDDKWSAPVNLGIEINSVNDDTHFQINTKTNQCVLASMAVRGDYFSYDLFKADMTGLNFPFLKK